MNLMTSLLAVISGESIIKLVVTLVIGALIYWVITWALGQFKLAEPFATVIRVLVVLAVAVFLIDALLAVSGHGFIRW